MERPIIDPGRGFAPGVQTSLQECLAHDVPVVLITEDQTMAFNDSAFTDSALTDSVLADTDTQVDATDAPTSGGKERRRYARRSVAKPCKIFHCPSRRYLAAKTCDLSSGGALIHLENGRPLAPGEEVLLVVDWNGKNILPSDRMVHGTVVRVAGAIGRHQSIGVQFAVNSELAAVA